MKTELIKETKTVVSKNNKTITTEKRLYVAPFIKRWLDKRKNKGE